jgi:hypothetical protein
MEKEYKTKDLKAEKVVKEEKLDLPIYEKRGKWCFKLKGGLYKFPTKKLATEKYLEIK